VNNIISGAKIAKTLLDQLAINIASIKNTHNIMPTLAIILIGDDYASKIYVNNKIKAAKNVGINTEKIEIESSVTTEDLLSIIAELNNNPDISGIIIQLPLPSHINKNEILFAIDPNKDVDGFHPLNVGYLNSNTLKGFVPCTALGILHLIKECEPDLTGKNIVVISRSQIVGRPLATLLLRANSTVTICHSKTKNLQSFTKNADIIISAIGIPKFFTTGFFNSNAIVIDVGISRLSDGSISGDVDFANVAGNVRYISPVPGGVGPMTVTFLLINTFKAFVTQHELN
jgi:methylenetetrahydrofolate dehydrogenase (NADP+) / methenyltetrahydrofolate cyclohydrolase